MKILMIHNRYRISGGEDRFVEDLTQQLQNASHTVISYTRDNDDVSSLSFFQKIAFFVCDIFFSRRSYQDVLTIIRREKPDVAHIHNTFYMISPSVYHACHDGGVPIVQQVHNYRFMCPVGTFYRDQRVCHDCQTQGIWSCARHRCWNHSLIFSAILVKIVERMQREVTPLIRLWITPSAFAAKMIQPLLKDTQSTVTIAPPIKAGQQITTTTKESFALYVGNLSDYKGIRTLLKAWQTMTVAQKLIIVGDGDLSEDVKAAAAQSKGAIEYLGALDHDRVGELMSRALFVISPSECYETFGLVIIEAFSFGTAVLASRLGPREDLIVEGVTGVFFKSGDSEDLAKQAKAMFADSKKTALLGVQAKQTYNKTYASQSMVTQIEKTYQSVLGRPC